MKRDCLLLVKHRHPERPGYATEKTEQGNAISNNGENFCKEISRLRTDPITPPGKDCLCRFILMS